jgi:hypothetical protein
LLPGQSDQLLVDLFDEVVPLLVEAVDRVFDLGNGVVRRVGASRRVFLVPEVEVGAMLFQNEEKYPVLGKCEFATLMPCGVGRIVEHRDRRRMKRGSVVRCS